LGPFQLLSTLSFWRKFTGTLHKVTVDISGELIHPRV
jgi:hypothetical protein